MSEAWAWLGAMIEGEGCVGLYPIARPRRAKIIVSSTSVETIATCLRLSQTGFVSTGQHKNASREWQWHVDAASDVQRILEEALPYLTEKHERASLVIDWCKNRRKS